MNKGRNDAVCDATDAYYQYKSLVQKAQQNVRNRVSFVKYSELPGMSEAYDHASFYSYDIHGNVDTLVQDYGIKTVRPNLMNKNGNRWKKIVYEYDLISGKVNAVKYQPKFADQWTHRYFYDAENRLTEVQTSEDGITWEKEAKYEYYLHGPLARTTLGHEQVQGIDYAYTLQGWLKGINSASYLHDMGGDSKAGSVNQYVGRDAVGLSLNYYDGEYKPVKAGVTPFPSYRGGAGSALPDSAYRPLYNGNISSALYNIRKFEENSHVPAFYNYRYDQLNRYIGQDGFFNFNAGNNSYGDFTPVNTYKERVSYDANGNIQAFTRYNIHPYGTPMDELAYKYYPGTNQLRQVTDQTPDWDFGAPVYDIDNQADTSNYVYDSIGNLIQDKAEKITNIQWNVYGKITEIRRNASTTDDNTTFWTKYKYDAQGNRIAKEWLWYVKDGNSGYQRNFTWYVRDAQGNLLSTYSTFTRDTVQANLANLWLQQEDIQLYGSSRLGMYRPTGRNVDDTTSNPFGPGVYYPFGMTHYRGERQYELTNHLGNVLTTISDRKIGVYSGSSLIIDSPNNISVAKVDFYEAEKKAAFDYFPFGMIARMNDGSGKYRFGFNGKENDNEVKGGIGSQQDYGMRVYDPRLGRFLSVDPLTKSYPWYTPYQFAGNKPIWAVDLDGLEEWYFNSGGGLYSGWTKSKLFTGPYRVDLANAAGYYTAEQVHASLSRERSHFLYQDRVQRDADAKEAARGVSESRNIFVVGYKLSPISGGVDAYKSFEAGAYGIGALSLIGAFSDFAPLAKAVGKEYSILARQLATSYSIQRAWSLPPLLRGIIIEAKLVSRYGEQGFEWMAETSPWFRAFDFYKKSDNEIVSLKTVDAAKNFDFKNIFDNIDALAEIKSLGKNAQYRREFVVKSARIDIAIPKGYKNMEKLADVIRVGELKLGAGSINVFEY